MRSLVVALVQFFGFLYFFCQYLISSQCADRLQFTVADALGHNNKEILITRWTMCCCVNSFSTSKERRFETFGNDLTCSARCDGGAANRILWWSMSQLQQKKSWAQHRPRNYRQPTAWYQRESIAMSWRIPSCFFVAKGSRYVFIHVTAWRRSCQNVSKHTNISLNIVCLSQP